MPFFRLMTPVPFNTLQIFGLQNAEEEGFGKGGRARGVSIGNKVL